MSAANNTIFKSSIGNKLLLSITGLFLCLFLVIHLIGNLQLLINDGGEAFVAYTEIMEANILIKTVSFILYAAILAHAVKGVILYRRNRAARGSQRYAVNHRHGSTWTSRNMIWLGSLLFVFIALHMVHFWYYFKFGNLHGVQYFDIVKEGFSNPIIVLLYVLAQIVLAYHLLHGFQSAFQTLGLRSGNYSKLIQNIGIGFSIVVPLLFAIIPICMYFEVYPMFHFKVFPGQ